MVREQAFSVDLDLVYHQRSRGRATSLSESSEGLEAERRGWGGGVVQATPYTAGGRTISFATPCDYFASPGKAKASTLALSVLVAIEMFNALNALSEVLPLNIRPRTS